MRLHDEVDRARPRHPSRPASAGSARPSAQASTRTNCPALAALAISGEWTTNSTMPSARSIFSTMVCGAWPSAGVALGLGRPARGSRAARERDCRRRSRAPPPARRRPRGWRWSRRAPRRRRSRHPRSRSAASPRADLDGAPFAWSSASGSASLTIGFGVLPSAMMTRSTVHASRSGRSPPGCGGPRASGWPSSMTSRIGVRCTMWVCRRRRTRTARAAPSARCLPPARGAVPRRAPAFRAWVRR